MIEPLEEPSFQMDGLTAAAMEQHRLALELHAASERHHAAAGKLRVEARAAYVAVRRQRDDLQIRLNKAVAGLKDIQNNNFPGISASDYARIVLNEVTAVTKQESP